MAFKFISFLSLLAVANCGVVSYEHPSYTTYTHAQPVHAVHAAPSYISQPTYVKSVPTYVAPQVITKVAQPVVAKVAEDYDPNPQYSFAYDVQDSLTGDSKSQHETRNGDNVEGHYSLVDADGFKRTVHYTADPVHGFNAQVQREPLTKTVHVAQPVVKAVHAAPIYAHAPAVVKTVHSAPVYAQAPAYYHH